MIVLLWLQAPSVLSSGVFFLGMALFFFILAQHVLDRLREVELKDGGKAQPLKEQWNSQLPAPDTRSESPSGFQSFPSSSTGEDDQFQIPYPEQM